jgi:twitching motility protein PilT
MSKSGLLGRLAVQMGMITRAQLREATREQGRHPDKRLGELLVDFGYIDEGQLGALLAAQARGGGGQQARRATPPPVKQAVPEGVKLGAIALKRVPAAELSGEALQPRDEKRRRDGAEARGWLLGLLSDAATSGASDILILPDQPVRLRRFGRVHDFTTGPVSASGAERLLEQTLDDQALARLRANGQVCVTFEAASVGRYRLEIHRERAGLSGCFHRLQAAKTPFTFGQLGLPNWLAGLTNFPHGLLLITGPGSSGRTATLGALVDLIAEERNDHIVVVESPTELEPVSAEAIITQLEVGTHVGSVRQVLGDSSRMDANVICTDELPADAVEAALHAADGDHLVLATRRAPSAARAVETLIDDSAIAERGAASRLVADTLRAVVNQRLVVAHSRDGSGEEVGRVLALEVLSVDDDIREMIRDGDLGAIAAHVRSGRARNSILLDDALMELVQSGRVTVEAARAQARHPGAFATQERGT